MGSTRKGKKAWRHIDTTAVEDDHAAAARAAKSGAHVATLPDDALFFVDTKPSAPPKKLTRREKVAAKGPLKVDAILQRNPLLEFPVPVPVRPSKRPHVKASTLALPPSAKKRKMGSAAGSLARPRNANDGEADVFDLWDDSRPEAAHAAAAAEAAAKRQKPPKSRHVPEPLGFEVCHPGASYLPADDAHQELLAKAVAVEHMKLLKQEMKPVQAPALGAVVAAQLAEELLCGPGDDDDDDDAEDDDGGDEAQMARRARRRTKADRNQALRARLAQQEAERNKRLKAQRRDVQNLEALNAQVRAAEEAGAERAARRAATRAERAASEPSRLGKRRFIPAPIAVPLSEEVTGSLRRVVPVATLLSDRYIALQRAEKIEPRVASRYVRSKSYIPYEPGSRGEKELAMHAETQALRKKKKQKPGGKDTEQ